MLLAIGWRPGGRGGGGGGEREKGREKEIIDNNKIEK